MKQLHISTLALALLAASGAYAAPDPEWQFDNYTVSGPRAARPQVHGDQRELFFQFPQGTHPSRFRIMPCQGKSRAVNPETRGPYFVIPNPGREVSIATNKGPIKVAGDDDVCADPSSSTAMQIPVKLPPPDAKKASAYPQAHRSKPSPVATAASRPKEPDPQRVGHGPVRGEVNPPAGKPEAKAGGHTEPFAAFQDQPAAVSKPDRAPRQAEALAAKASSAPEPATTAAVEPSPVPAAKPYTLAIHSGDSLRSALTKAMADWGLSLSWNLGRDRLSTRDFHFTGNSPSAVIDQALQAFELKGWLTADNHTLYIEKESE